MTATLVQVENITKRFGGLTAVDHVTFSVPVGAITAVIGPNGAGKTTLFNLISGIHRADDGRVHFDGREVTNWPTARIAQAGIVRTFQIVRLFRQLTALENVLVGFHLNTRGNVLAAVASPRWARQQEQSVHEAGRELLNMVGLANSADVAAVNLTGGQQRLLEIARALAAKPKLLMLDEPAAGLNATETAELMRLMTEIRRRGTAILLVEHDMHLVMRIADEVQVLNFGQRIAGGTPQLVQSHPAVIEAYLGAAPNSKDAAHA